MSGWGYLLTGGVLAGSTSYLLGAVNPAVLIAQGRGVNLLQVGSGNPGAANAGRALGRRTGVLVALLDVAKGAAPAAAWGAFEHPWGLVAGLAAVLGHVSSPYLRGKGGKGVATAAGAILGSHPLWLVPALLVWLIVLGVSRWIALASICAGFTVLVVAVLSAHDIWWGCVLAAVIVLRHKANVLERLRPQPDLPSTGSVTS